MIRILLDECLPVKLKHRFREADPLANFSISIIAFRTKSNRYKDVLPHLSEACDRIRNCKPGMFYAFPEIRERG